MADHRDQNDADEPIDVSTLDDLVGVLEDLDARLTHLEERPPAVEDTSPDDFIEWVEWLRSTYLLDARIPKTWPDIAFITAELVALHLAHRASYGPDAGPFDPLTWHDALGHTLPCLADWRSENRRRNSRAYPRVA